MIIDVHVAFLFASVSVMFGLAYTIGAILDKKTAEVLAKRAAASEQGDLETILGA